ncbi:MAG: cation:proton antiporter [Clostridia bacterium]|nr:cation:proton antiporter [Clostridia bacterium]MBQ8859410.1 cation:proton antiporter [Clostridia bacterium]
MEILFSLSIALFAGLMLSRLAKLVKLPAVTAYLVAGILVGPFCLGAFGVEGLGFVSMEQIESYSLISDVALGFIAFSIGNEFRLSQLKTIGKQATVIGIIQAVFTTLVVDAALVGLHFIIPDKLSLPAALVLGAVASATAPAATLMVVRQYKAKGPLTDTLLPVVALDDAVGLVLFSISFGVAKALIAGPASIAAIILEPLIEVVLSLALGAGMGYLFTFFERFFHSRSKRLSMSVAFVFLTLALSMLKFEIPIAGGVHVAFSSLLTCMMLGTIFCNICDFSAELMDRLDRWTAPIFILFFVLSGAEFDLTVLTDLLIVLIGLVYIVFRCLGKYFGARLSATWVKSDENIRKYLGITLFPQAGVALGMAIKAMTLGETGTIVANITLFSVLIYELVGPFLTKEALIKAGEVNPEGKTSARAKAK